LFHLVGVVKKNRAVSTVMITPVSEGRELLRSDTNAATSSKFNVGKHFDRKGSRQLGRRESDT
jgi:hypothetical protein